MHISFQKSNQLKTIAILMMLCLHLFNRDYTDLFTPHLLIGDQTLSYYVSLFCDACVPVFAFVSGYGLYASYINKSAEYLQKNLLRTKKLYIRYWIVLLLFVVLLGYILGKEGYPGSWQKFILNLTGFVTSYNGAWWYFTIYILFIFSSAFWFCLLEKMHPYLYLGLLFLVYIVAFYFRIYRSQIFSDPILLWIHTEATLYFCTLFQFMLGAFALKYNWQQKVSILFNKVKYRNAIAILGVIALITLHGLVPNLIIAPFTALGFIFLFLQMRLGKMANKVLDYFNPHSTNIWLIHMFFYLIYFKKNIYAPQYPIIVFGWLVFLCLISSYLINFIYNKLEKTIL